MTLDTDWFSEPLASEGVAFSLRVTSKLHEERTPWQYIEVYETAHWGRLLVIDGCVMLTGRDNFLYHEMMAHPALATHPAPRDVLVIGGGDCGTLREVLRHESVTRAVQVDIDEAVTRAAERFFPELTAGNDDPRVTLRFEDGVAYLRQAPAASFDVVIIDSTDPVGHAAGLFGAPFLSDVRRVLRSPGVLVQQSESPLLHAESVIRPLHGALAEAGFAARATLHFPVPSYPSGWWSATLGLLGLEPEAYRTVTLPELRYYSAAMHQAALTPPAFCGTLFRPDRPAGGGT
ncbi:polyamine aminopropyltransferase [Sediminicurvatus halobius]|uniref:Polyamine aminopropyltransferase n=1 Tax=Sediminicurvatus halobius TaxID=2182432 RepID=A0A2U2N701_9GAMM|nr:polyamine aminopropyltransferase [Spiribacter halobius]PWG64981.1 polyamine aminopropyltransferase [Spiribacter halobius]UEX78285.1 polyamine aminopropyltransferase [Spiribacter halobius]